MSEPPRMVNPQASDDEQYDEKSLRPRKLSEFIGQEKVWGYPYQGMRYDCGSKEGFLEATVELALQHPQVGASFRDYLKGLSL